MAEGGDVFLLDMGKPVKILDLAKKMIRLKGYTLRDEESPDGDIEIRFTGLKPGEKLYEELLVGGAASGTQHRKILRAEENYVAWAKLRASLNTLEQACDSYDYGAIKAFIEGLIEGSDLAAQLGDLTTTAEVVAIRQPDSGL
jgi:FlaA1/EpsC-like NDP-sugar epimerase